MKIKLLVILIGVFFLFAGVNNSQAQRIRGALYAGTNLSQIDGDNVFGFKKWGANLGAGVIVPLNKKSTLFTSMELLYSQKGAYEETPQGPDTAAYPHYKATLNYAQIPLLFYYEDKKFISGGLGFSWSRLVGVEEIVDGIETPSSITSDLFNKNDFSVLVDVRLRIYKQLKFNVRYEYSMVPIRTKYSAKKKDDVTWYNNTLTFRLIWVFNEKISEQAMKDE